MDPCADRGDDHGVVVEGTGVESLDLEVSVNLLMSIRNYIRMAIHMQVIIYLHH